MKDKRARSGRSASSPANIRAANFRFGPTVKSSSAARPTWTWSWSRTWFRASTPRSLTDDHVVTIQDLGSTNGTFVNGEKVRKAELKDGDRILIGTSIIKIIFVDGESTSHLDRDGGALEDGGRGEQAPIGGTEVDGGQHRGDPAARPAAAAVDQPQVGRAGDPLRPARGQDLLPQGPDLLRQHREPVQHRPAQGADAHAGLDAGLVRAGTAGRVGGAGGAGRFDRGAADREHAPAGRVQGGRREAARAVVARSA